MTSTPDEPTPDLTPPAHVVADLATANDWTHEELDHLATEHPHLREQITATHNRIDDCEARGVLLLPDSETRSATTTAWLDLASEEPDHLSDGDHPYVTDDEDEICL